ncbi:hypothetical protein AB7Y15_18625 [Morganella morganii]|uniref:gp53-like domain-containing protein n=1 Tax=Morganella morganii TaxID=582 RepID=UPI0034E4A875
MKLNDIPKLMPVPFGVNGPREEIREESLAGQPFASYSDGFPPITMLMKQAGGLPPQGKDMNQILFELASGQRWSNSGAGYKFNKTFSEAVGGYPKGAQLLSNDGTKVYVSTKDDNKTDFNTSPGADWVTLGSYIGLNDYALKTDVDKKLDKDAVVQATGTSTTNVMSQKSVTEELKNKASNTDLTDGLNKKFDKTGGVLTGNDNVITIRNSGTNRANFIQGENNQENAEWMVGRLGLGSDVSLYSAAHGLSIAIRSDGAYVNNDKIMAGVASLLDDRGYIKFGDSGLILQWGLTPNPIGGESVDLSFPIPFPTKCLGGVITPTGSSGDAGFLTSWFHILSRSGFRLTNARTGTTVKYSFYWFAWGK